VLAFQVFSYALVFGQAYGQATLYPNRKRQRIYFEGVDLSFMTENGTILRGPPHKDGPPSASE
jgi:hypothetical protein